jgi:probable rRNA maturation factor
VLFRGVPARLRRRPLRAFADRLRLEVAGGRSFECLISGDAELARLNAAFRGRAYATDVLSFPAGNRAGRLGEIAISWERAAEQAMLLGHSVQQEIGILMLHGLLHLLGYDHENDGGHMARMETAWRRKLELPRALIERSLV